MSFGQSIATVFSKYSDFTGRAARPEYWWWVLFSLAVSLPAYYIHPVLYLFVVVFLFVPGLAVAVRRLHDTGRSGWYLLISLIPFVGALILLVFLASEGDFGPNEYGDIHDAPSGHRATELTPPSSV